MRSASAGSRLLLRRLRQVVAEPVSAQNRLDKIVLHIAAHMIAEVCSIYILRNDGWLELYATEGLSTEAVHVTTLHMGEGLVGLIAKHAESLNLSDVQSHPDFSYRPETGEEIYHSFLGVPILKEGNILGVLVIQNEVSRIYSQEEVEVLETTAMLLADMIDSGQLQNITRPSKTDSSAPPLSLKGCPISDGVGIGKAIFRESRIRVTRLLAEDPAQEMQRLETAVSDLQKSLDELIDRGNQAGAGEHREVLETFRLFAHDPGWIRRLREAVMTGLTAEAAVERVQNNVRAKLRLQTDAYLRERLHDLDDLANRLLHHLTGASLVVEKSNLPENAILVARTMGPAALLDYERSRIRGLILEDGGISSHVAIVARSLNIPAVSGVPNITNLAEADDKIIVDGISGDIQIRPSAEVEEAYFEKGRLRASRQAHYLTLKNIPAISQDGIPLSLQMNAGLLSDLPQLEEIGAHSIALFRTELQFMIASKFPTIREQHQFYKDILDSVPNASVTFRTLDIGGDKLLPYMATWEEKNPALGWRAIRIGLDRPGLLRAQLRALLRASAGRELRVLLPMITIAAEVDQARALLNKEVAYLIRHGRKPPASIKLGVMVEVPAVLWQLDEILARSDFLSVGSNDLVQYLFAADRENKKLSERFDSLSLPILRVLKAIIVAGESKSKPVNLCGEMGGNPLDSMALIGLGYRQLSMAPSALGAVKAMVLALNVADITNFMNNLLHHTDGGASLRGALLDYAQTHNIPL